MFFGLLEIYRFFRHYKMLLYSVVQMILIKFPYDIVQGLIAIGSVNRLIINEVNHLFKSKCSVKNFHIINQGNGWTLNTGALDFSLFYSDGLYLLEKGNLKLG